MCPAPSLQGLAVPLSDDEVRWGATATAPSLNRQQLAFISVLLCSRTTPTAATVPLKAP